MPDVNCLFLANVNIKSSRDGCNAYSQLKLQEKTQKAILTALGVDMNTLTQPDATTALPSSCTKMLRSPARGVTRRTRYGVNKMHALYDA